jgi:hypothetical protein
MPRSAFSICSLITLNHASYLINNMYATYIEHRGTNLFSLDGGFLSI